MNATVEVCDDIPPFEFKDFLEWVERLKKDIPEEYWDSAKVSIGSEMSYDQDYPTCLVSYERPETPEEHRRRTENEYSAKERVEAYERDLYDKLRKKFEQK